MSKKYIVTVTALTLVFLGVSYMTAQGQAPRGANREADKQAIEKLIKDQIQAFNNRDAAAITANWTADAEYGSRARYNNCYSRWRGDGHAGTSESGARLSAREIASPIGR